ncbi:hypothetical protein [Streptomyces bikiniensis]|uniref:hypothetical protein n=1 Tax=Streptomyces bikiniensis TaxID=1896 RepID=UPI00068EC35D|nr:hypothetical protein [Streptomyces bikiniensis]
MNHSGNIGQNIDQDAVLRARTMLLGSDRLDPAEELEAYRILAEVSPAAYLPKLVGALLSYGSGASYGHDRERKLALRAEALDTARRIDVDHPRRTEVFAEALEYYGLALIQSGRRAEGRAAYEEMAAVGRDGFERGQVKHPAYGSGRLAVVLAEEGRHGEAADLLPQGDRTHRDFFFWSVVEKAAELEAAGRREEAVEVFTDLVDDTREDRRWNLLVWELVHRSRMLDAAGRHGEAGADRREALSVLTWLAGPDAPERQSGLHSWWSVLYGLSARAVEPDGSPDAPMPAFGNSLLHWSWDMRTAYFDGIPALEAETARLSAAGRLTELVTAHHRLTVRSTLMWTGRTHLFEEPLRPLFDEEVALARRAAEGLPRALTDRATFLLAAGRYEEARADFAEVVGPLDGAERTPIVTAT